jgi:hypothetical protein
MYTFSPRQHQKSDAICLSTSHGGIMSQQKEDGRVLSRMGARELTPQETEQVSGALVFRPRCTFDPVHCTMDGICSPPPAC